MDMDKKRHNIMQRIKRLPPGSHSPSNRYWCATCKKFFNLNSPVCPFMTKMCVNTPIAIENLNPESTEGIEKMGLFYPRLPQELLSKSITDDYLESGKKLAGEYIEFLKDWKIKYKNQPIQTIKSFLIIISGAETAQRVNQDEITFVFLDVERNWEKDKLIELIKGALPVLTQEVDIKQKIKLDSISIMGDKPMGKYYCSACKMFFEFGMERDKITCPLMAQKCMFTPTNIKDSRYSVKDLIKIYRVSPDLYKRFMKVVGKDSNRNRAYLKDRLKQEWDLEVTEDELNKLAELLGA